MTRLSVDAEALVEETGKRWVKLKTILAGREAAIRRRIASEMADLVRNAELEVATMAHLARAAGATKTALMSVTTKHPGGLERFLRMVEPANLGPAAEVATQ